uniref:Uncharacterized protein n=1 Tax=Oryza punctata TaxID=4537 RepID=A0A0E0JFD8_ORYPU
MGGHRAGRAARLHGRRLPGPRRRPPRAPDAHRRRRNRPRRGRRVRAGARARRRGHARLPRVPVHERGGRRHQDHRLLRRADPAEGPRRRRQEGPPPPGRQDDGGRGPAAGHRGRGRGRRRRRRGSRRRPGGGGARGEGMGRGDRGRDQEGDLAGALGQGEGPRRRRAAAAVAAAAVAATRLYPCSYRLSTYRMLLSCMLPLRQDWFTAMHPRRIASHDSSCVLALNCVELFMFTITKQSCKIMTGSRSGCNGRGFIAIGMGIYMMKEQTKQGAATLL